MNAKEMRDLTFSEVECLPGRLEVPRALTF